MALKERVNEELTELKALAADANFQARLAKAEASSELRKLWMETEQNIAILEARLEKLGDDADDAVDNLLVKVKDGWTKLRKQL
jgi:hypothetical protein